MLTELHHQAINFTIQHPALLQTVQSFAREISPPAATPMAPDQITPPANENAAQKPFLKNDPTRAPKLAKALWSGNAAKALGTTALAATTFGLGMELGLDGFWAGAVAFASGALAAFKIPNPATALAREVICLDLKHGNPDDAQVTNHIATLRSLGMSDSDIYDQACPFSVFPNDREPTRGHDSWRVFLEKNFEDGLLGFGMRINHSISSALHRLGMRESLPTMLKTLQQTSYYLVFSKTLEFIAKFPDSPEFDAALEEIAKRSQTGDLNLARHINTTVKINLGNSFYTLIKTPSGCDKFSAKIKDLICDKATPKESRIELAQHLCRLEKTPTALDIIEAITWNLLLNESDIDRFDILKAMIAEMIHSESTKKSCAGVLRMITREFAKIPDYKLSDIQVIELLYPVTVQ